MAVPDLRGMPPELIELLRKNEDGIKKMLPETWTHMHNLNGLQLGFQLKLMGFDWRSQDQFGAFMVAFEKAGLLLRDGMLIRRNHHQVFKEENNEQSSST